MSLAEARAEASALRTQIKAAADPVAERRTARDQQHAESARTFARGRDLYLAWAGTQGLSDSTLTDYRLLLKSRYLAPLEHRPISAIRKGDIAAVFDALAGDGKATTANRMRVVLNRLLPMPSSGICWSSTRSRRPGARPSTK